MAPLSVVLMVFPGMVEEENETYCILGICIRSYGDLSLLTTSRFFTRHPGPPKTLATLKPKQQLTETWDLSVRAVEGSPPFQPAGSWPRGLGLGIPIEAKTTYPPPRSKCPQHLR